MIETELCESEVHEIVSRRLAGTCFVYGARRELRCYQDATLPSYTGLRDVTSIGEGAHHVCAVASRGGHRTPWLYCWGLAAPTRGSPDWLNLGPHGLDHATMSPLPADALGLVFRTPRPVVPVPEGTRVDLRGFVTCVQTPDGRTLCHSPVGGASEPLPGATRDAGAIQCPADVPAGFEPECERFDH